MAGGCRSDRRTSNTGLSAMGITSWRADGFDTCGPTPRALLPARAVRLGRRTFAPLLGARRADAAGTSTAGRARSAILLFLSGGPSQLDMWDPKPEAPEEVRGSFRPIATRVPGVHVTEHLPRMAALADRYAVVRSTHHS